MGKEGYIPEFAKKGILISPENPQPLIRQNAETNREWEFQPVADKWYPITEEIKRTLFDGVFTLEKTSPLPSPPIAIEPMRNYRTLASYRIVPDGYGLNDKLTLNAQHFVNNDGVWVWDWGGDWGLAEKITHELAHEKHKHWGDTPPDHGKYFRNLLLELGIFCTPMEITTARQRTENRLRSSCTGLASKDLKVRLYCPRNQKLATGNPKTNGKNGVTPGFALTAAKN